MHIICIIASISIDFTPLFLYFCGCFTKNCIVKKMKQVKQTKRSAQFIFDYSMNYIFRQ